MHIALGISRTKKIGTSTSVGNYKYSTTILEYHIKGKL